MGYSMSVYDEKVGGFPHGFRLVDNYSDDGVSSQRDKKNQAVSDGLSDFSAVGLLGQLDGSVPLIIVFKFSDIAV